MIAEYRSKTNRGVGFGIPLELIGLWLLNLYRAGGGGPVLLAIGVVILMTGFVLYVWGCVCYAIGKGYHPAVGYLGLLSIWGLLVLAILRDRNKARLAEPSPPRADEI